MQPNPQLISVRDLAARLGIGRTMAYALVAAGEIRSIRIGDRVLIPASEPDRFIADHLAMAPSVT